MGKAIDWTADEGGAMEEVLVFEVRHDIVLMEKAVQQARWELELWAQTRKAVRACHKAWGWVEIYKSACKTATEGGGFEQIGGGRLLLRERVLRDWDSWVEVETARADARDAAAALL